MNILQRINEVRKKVPFIQKDAKVQNYKAVTHDQVTSAVRDSLIEFGVVIIPKEVASKFIDTGTFTSSGTPIMRFEATYNITFYNCDDMSDFIEFPLTAHAMDFGDKAPGKCVSYVTKSAILKVFNIETGENDESRIEPSRTVKDNYLEAFVEHKKIITDITEAIASDDLEAAIKARNLLSDAQLQSIWVAPLTCKKLGIPPPFTTAERNIMKSAEWLSLATDMKEHYQEDTVLTKEEQE